jgi:hypothetical protein
MTGAHVTGDERYMMYRIKYTKKQIKTSHNIYIFHSYEILVNNTGLIDCNEIKFLGELGLP